MKLKKNSDKDSYYKFDIFEGFSKKINHAVSTRKHRSLDSIEDLSVDSENRKAFGDLVGIPAQSWLFSHQVHGDEIHIIDEPVKVPFKFSEGDALITNIPGQAIFVKMADCQAVLLFDPEKNVIAAVHSGWRGSVQNIIGKVVDKMEDHFGCDPSNILAGISYSLGPCCSYFTYPYVELPKSFHRYIAHDKHSVDFWKASIDQLLAAGLKKANIECARICTKCKKDEFYSYRAEKDKAGRMGAVICLK